MVSERGRFIMAYKLTQLPTDPMVELVYTGQVSPDELMRSAMETFELVSRSQIDRVLTDCSGMAGGHSIFDLLKGIEKLLAAGGPHLAKFKEAIVLPAEASKEAKQNVRFWETACRNRGLTVQVFFDRESAILWLRA